MFDWRPVDLVQIHGSELRGRGQKISLGKITTVQPMELIFRCNLICLLQTKQLIMQERATAIVVLPIWPTRPWFPRALQQLIDLPRLIPLSALVLPQKPSFTHKLGPSLTLAAMLLSGDPCKIKEFRRKLQTSSFHHGETAQRQLIGLISRNGVHFVSNGVMIHFVPL